MSKRLLVLGLAVALAAYISLPVQAFGRRHHRDCCGDTGVAYGGGCGTCCAAPAAGCCQTVTYQPQVITCYEQRIVERQVPCQVRRPVTRTEVIPCSYQVQVPVTHTEQRQIMTCQQVQRQVPCTVTEYQQITVPVTHNEVFCTTVQRQVPYTYTVQRQITEQVPQNVTTYVQVQRQVPVTVCELQQYTEQVPQNVTTYVTVQKQVPVTVCETQQVTEQVP